MTDSYGNKIKIDLKTSLSEKYKQFRFRQFIRNALNSGEKVLFKNGRADITDKEGKVSTVTCSI